MSSRDALALARLSASEQQQLIRRGELAPSELLDACLQMVERWNGQLNAVCTLASPEELRAEARRADERLVHDKGGVGPLHGLPVGIKDVTPVAGLRTTYGSPLYADHVPAEDALVVERLKAAGAMVLGKTNCPEFAAGGNTWNAVFGRTRNPWNPAKSAGGSTGGGAVGLATGMISLAEGTDLGGSLRIPASFCGVVGLRPSLGLVPTVPSDWRWDTLQVTGPMARTAEDVALMLDAISGPSERAPLSAAPSVASYVEALRTEPRSRLRIAYCRDIAGIGVDPEIARLCRQAIFTVDGADIEEIELDLSFARPAFLALRGLWMVTHMYERMEHLEAFGPNVRGNVEAGLGMTTSDLAAAEHARARVFQILTDLFRGYSLFVTPTMAVPPFPVEENYPETVAGRRMETYVDWIAPTFLLSLTSLPIASVPCGRDAAGLPVGLQVVGPPRTDDRVLGFAQRLQHAHPIGLPPLPPDLS